MATYRQIHTSFWQDGFVLGLTPEEKYFYIYLMTNSKTTQCGIYELPKRVIEMETGYNRETVDKLLDRFIKYKKIMYSEDTQEVMLLNWIKYNAINSPKVKACIKKELQTIKNRAFISTFHNLCIQYRYSIDAVSIDLGEEKEEEKEKEKEIKDNIYAPPFNDPIKNHLHRLCEKCKLKGYNIVSADDLFEYIDKMEIEVIESAIKKAYDKHFNYAINTLEGWLKEGKTKVIYLKPKRRDDIARPRTSVSGDDFDYNKLSF